MEEVDVKLLLHYLIQQMHSKTMKNYKDPRRLKFIYNKHYKGTGYSQVLQPEDGSFVIMFRPRLE